MRGASRLHLRSMADTPFEVVVSLACEEFLAALSNPITQRARLHVFPRCFLTDASPVRHKTFRGDINRPRNEIDPRYRIAAQTVDELEALPRLYGQTGGDERETKREREGLDGVFCFCPVHQILVCPLSTSGIRPTARM